MESWLLLLHILLALLFGLRVLYVQKNTGTVFAWLILLLLLPVAGALLYLLIGEPRLGRRRDKRSAEITAFFKAFGSRYLTDNYGKVDEREIKAYNGIERIAGSNTGMDVTVGNRLELLHTTDTILEHMLADIRGAQHSCLLEFYIIDPQGRITALLQAVMEAAKRGVDCRILADAVGSHGFWRGEWPARLRAAGVDVQIALPVSAWRSFFTRTDLRNHRKLLIVDHQVGYTGSFNLVDPQYFKRDAGVGEWVDVMMRCRGPLVWQMAAVFYADMMLEKDESLETAQARMGSLKTFLPEKEQVVAADGVNVQVVPSAPDQAEKVIYDTLLCALYNAERKVVITTPYFVPDEPLLTALTTAARRGVEVTLVLPYKVDSVMVRYASQAYYPMLLKAGVKIALFKEGLLHAKTMTIDDKLSLFGTVNMDMRSFFLNLEVSLAIYDEAITQMILQQQQAYLAKSEYVTVKAWKMRSKWWSLVENSVRLVGPLL